MGLLAMRRLTTFIALLLMVYAGCSYLRLQGSMRPGQNDWTMYGGGIGRTNAAHDLLVPPLRLMWEYDGGAGFGASAGVVVDNVLFVADLQGEVYAIDAATGKEKGVHDFGSAIAGSPAIDDGQLYVALAHDEASLLRYDLWQAGIVWTARLGDIESSPLLLAEHLYVTALRGKLLCIDKNRGDIVWSFEVPGAGHRPLIHSSPASDGKTVVFGCDDGNLYAVDIASGNLRWKASTGGSVVASPSISSGTVFFGSLDNSFYAFDVQTGSLLWRQTLAGRIFASQAVSGDHVYVGTAARLMYCLDRTTGAIVWQYEAMGVINAAPVVSGDVLYFACIDKSMYALQARTGGLLWQYKTDSRIKTMPIVWKKYLFVFGEDRSVLAFTQGTDP